MVIDWLIHSPFTSVCLPSPMSSATWW